MTDPDYAKKLLDNTENIGELWSEWDEWGEHYALRPYNDPLGSITTCATAFSDDLAELFVEARNMAKTIASARSEYGVEEKMPDEEWRLVNGEDSWISNREAADELLAHYREESPGRALRLVRQLVVPAQPVE